MNAREGEGVPLAHVIYKNTQMREAFLEEHKKDPTLTWNSWSSMSPKRPKRALMHTMRQPSTKHNFRLVNMYAFTYTRSRSFSFSLSLSHSLTHSLSLSLSLSLSHTHTHTEGYRGSTHTHTHKHGHATVQKLNLYTDTGEIVHAVFVGVVEG